MIGNKEWNSFNDMDRDYKLDDIPEPTEAEKKLYQNDSYEEKLKRDFARLSKGNRLTPKMFDIIRFIDKHNRPVSPMEISNSIGNGVGTWAGRELRKMVSMNLVKKVGFGLYEIEK